MHNWFQKGARPFKNHYSKIGHIENWVEIFEKKWQIFFQKFHISYGDFFQIILGVCITRIRPVPEFFYPDLPGSDPPGTRSARYPENHYPDPPGTRVFGTQPITTWQPF